MIMKNRFFIPLAFLITFLLGGATGYFAAKNLSPAPPVSERFVDEPPRQDRQFRALRNRLITELELTSDQEEPFFTLLEHHRRDMRRMMENQRREYDKAMTAHSDSLHESLASILSPEQLQTWEERYSRAALMERQRHQRREGRSRNW
jgi:Spy/CpxP family protein refolding chaperone